MTAKLILLIVVVALILTACDTCTGGENMANPRLVAGLEQSEAAPMIRIAWDQGSGPGAELPPAYFEKILVEEGEDWVQAIEKSGEREITVVFNDLAGHLQDEQNSLHLRLVFPDRAAHISCFHLGAPDAYLLELDLNFMPDGTLDEATFRQSARLGPM
jgi:hypothetical protein